MGVPHSSSQGHRLPTPGLPSSSRDSGCRELVWSSRGHPSQGKARLGVNCRGPAVTVYSS